MTVKEQVRQLADKLPDSATWDDVLYEVYVHQAVEQGLADADAGRTVSQEQVEREFLK
jgi:predicted transcriptional regulator